MKDIRKENITHPLVEKKKKHPLYKKIKRWEFLMSSRFRGSKESSRRRNWEGDGIAGNGVKDHFSEENVNEMEGILEKENSVVVEVGCGTGEALHQLAGLYPKINLLGVDLYPENKSGSKKEDEEDQGYALIGARVGDIVGSLPFKDKSVDLFYSVQVYRHVIEKLALISEICRSLKRDGLAFIHLREKNSSQVIEPKLEKIIKDSNLSSCLETEIVETEGVDQRILRIDGGKLPERVEWNVSLNDMDIQNDDGIWKLKSIYK